MRHLDDLLYQQLVSTGGMVSPEVREHLLSDCDLCAAYLTQRPRADALDGRVDAALLPQRSAPGPAGELELILSRVERRPAWPRVLLTVAALGLFGVGLSTQLRSGTRPSREETGLKGEAPMTVSASVAVVAPDGQVRAGAPGATVSPADALSLRLELSRDARISLVRVDRKGAEVLLQNEAIPAGTHDLRRQGQALGIPMAGLSGEQRVQVVASDRDLSPAEIESSASGTAVPGAVVGSVSVRVAP